MRNFFANLFKRLAKNLEVEKQEVLLQPIEIEQDILIETEAQTIPTEIKKIRKKKDNPTKKKGSTKVTVLSFDQRDMMEVMEYPFLSLSKNRKSPIHYERKTSRGFVKVKVSCHTEHYIASIYDWDIIMFVESKMQEIMNSTSDIPPRAITIPRNELLKALHKHNGKKEEKDLKSSLARLKTTLIETNIRNEDGRYDAGFSFLDSWKYTERKDIKEIKITLSQWLYDGICRKGALLKVVPEYFDITSGLKKFLYRTARKHAGNGVWEFTLETLYEKSGSEQELKKFKYDLKKAVLDNDLPSYFTEWIEQEGKISIRFTNKLKELKKILSQEAA